MPRVAIVGGGAAGVLVAVHLLRESGGRCRPWLIEPRAALGEGIAYSTRDPAHRLNVRAGNMSLFADLPDDFVRHAESAADGPATNVVTLAQRYLPRTAFAGYLQATLAGFAPGDDFHVRDSVVDVAFDNGFRLRLGSGAVLDADAVVIATGNAPRPPLLPCEGLIHAWDYPAVAAIDRADDVAILGSGLSMVDAAMTLASNGHLGRIDVFSRHGLLPLRHHDLGGPHGDVGSLHALGLRGRLRALRRQAEVLASEGKPWQWVMDQLRPHGRALWQSLSPREQSRFLRHAVRQWDIHRHRIAPEVAEQLETLLHGGHLRIHAARVLGIESATKGMELRYRPRGGAIESAIHADRIIDATGIESRPAALPSSLLGKLVVDGKVAPGPHGLGIAVDGDGVVQRPGGGAFAGLHAIGTPRLGVEWETTAIPDLRVQAQSIARRLLRGAG